MNQAISTIEMKQTNQTIQTKQLNYRGRDKGALRASLSMLDELDEVGELDEIDKLVKLEVGELII